MGGATEGSAKGHQPNVDDEACQCCQEAHCRRRLDDIGWSDEQIVQRMRKKKGPNTQVMVLPCLERSTGSNPRGDAKVEAESHKIQEKMDMAMRIGVV